MAPAGPDRTVTAERSGITCGVSSADAGCVVATPTMVIPARIPAVTPAGASSITTLLRRYSEHPGSKQVSLR
jgi:hypothetical protein